MQFYKIEGIIRDEGWIQEMEDRRARSAKTRKILSRTLKFNAGLQKKAFYFVSDDSDDLITIGAIYQEPQENREEQLAGFLSGIGMELDSLYFEEITLRALDEMLDTAEKKKYIDDNETILEQFGLDGLASRYGRGLAFEESMIAERGREDVYAETEKYLSKGTLVPELDRIYAGRVKDTAVGHPVHYMVESDDTEIQDGISGILLEALYANDRICNRRYCVLDMKVNDHHRRGSHDELYKSCIGGAVVVCYQPNDDTESAYASCDGEMIEYICGIAEKYAHQVLTVFCLPRECSKIRNLFYGNLGSMSFVELKEDFVSGERAQGFFERMAAERGIETDRKLYDKMEVEKGYLSTELRFLFDEWYNGKLKTAVYPQYAEILSVKRESADAAPSGTAYDELMEMVGLDEAKKVIIRALNYYKAQKLFAEKGMQPDQNTMHLVFTGNPGTAKTSVARLFARIMKENNLLSKGVMVETGRGDLVGKYVGWTAPTIKEKFKEAMGGVLFIDEAYSLVDDRDGSFGDEAINTIVQEMENHRDDVAVIFAGYPDKMERFLQKNPGLRSRIAYHVPFPDYDTGELCRIADLMAAKKGIRLTDGAREKLSSIFEAARKEENFGNGRYVRTAIEKARRAQATRLLGMDFDSITENDVATICEEDIEMPEMKRQEKRRIGFSCAENIP